MKYTLDKSGINRLRWFIRKQVRFSTYFFYIAPLIGWPKVTITNERKPNQ